ncbi:MAG: IS66 family insertion sequence element accessory protein TnpB [Lachnospiraceae bacterium]|nr:IS66 family insertion sequence element accessory protein TnpB [Lachnospiraceae bacterium]
MDQLTHTVRRSNWINIIRQCQDRPAGTTAKQWLAENDISEKSYYYWLRKIRREVCEQEGLQEATNPSALSFVEIPVKTALDTAPVPTVPAAMTPVAVIRSGRLTEFNKVQIWLFCCIDNYKGVCYSLLVSRFFLF